MKYCADPKQIELDNYVRTILDLSRENPEILYRVIELARKDCKRDETVVKK